MIKLFLTLVLFSATVTDDTFLTSVGPPLPPQGGNTRLIASRRGGTLQSRIQFRTDTVRPWHVLELTNLAQNSPNAQINAYNVVGWDWDEATATWQNRQGTIQNPVVCTLTFYGDANLDGKVDTVDNDIVNAHWQQNTDKWTDGDFNGDGKVTSKDLNLLGINNNRDVATEPARVIYIPRSGDNIALEPINTSSVRVKSKEN